MNELLKVSSEIIFNDARVVAFNTFGQIVLLQALSNGPKRGRLELPGGRPEPVGGNLEDAIRRSAKESTGVDVRLRDKEPVMYQNYKGEKAIAVLADIVVDESVDVEVTWRAFTYNPAEHQRIMQTTPQEALRDPWLHSDTEYVLEVLEQRRLNELTVAQAA